MFYSPEELAVLEVKKKETSKFPQSSKLTVLQANILVAMLAGYWGRAGDGHPGAQILAEGLRLLEVLVWYAKQKEPGPARPRGRARSRRGPT